MDSMTSTKRMTALSTQPPIPPARMPSRAPTESPIAVDTTPYTSDWRAPKSSCVRRSEPKRSSPSGWSSLGPAR